MGQSTPTTAFDMLPLQYRHIEPMHERVWFGKNNFRLNDIYENLDYFSSLSFDI